MKFKLLRKILTVTSFILFGVMIVGTLIANENATIISQQLGAQTYKIVEKENSDEDTEYIKSEYTKVGDVIKAGHETAKQVLGEGIVLLKNDNNALPLSSGDKVSMFGSASADPVYGGTGSGTISTTDAVSFYKSFTDAGLQVNETMYEYMSDKGSSRNPGKWFDYARGTSGSYGGTVLKINDAPWDIYQSIAGTTLDEYNNAIVVFGRIGGEGYDLIRKGGEGDAIDNNDGLGYDYLGLNQNELSILTGLKALKDEGKIKKIIVLINYSSMIEGSFIKDPQYGVDAALWVGATGIGGAAVGEVLTGKINPSGRLPDTMWMDNAMNPVNVNFYPYIYSNADSFGVPTYVGSGQYPEVTLASYSVYQEGMYLGYRYTETRYEDVVLGTSKVGNYNYNDVVAYPFGYGLSYTEFEYSDATVTKTGDREYTVSVKVTNAGKAAGKVSVPIWISKPYGKYARDNQIQVPSVELIDFGKTGIIEPGKSEVLTVKMDEKFFASYDAWGTKGYVLMDGDYYVAVGGSAHEAVNNLLMAKKENGIKIDESKMVGSAGNAGLVTKFTLSFNKSKYEVSDAVSSLDGKTQLKVTNLFDFADINRYEGRGDNHVNYYNRDNWEGTVSLDMTNGHPLLKMTEQMVKEIYAQVPEGTGKSVGVPEKYKQPIAKDDGAYPTYGAKNGLQLLDMKYDEKGEPVAYNDPIWDKFMDQITWDEMVAVLENGFHLTIEIPSVTKPATKDENGPNGFGGWAFRQGYYTGRGLAYRTEVKAGHLNESGEVDRSKADPDGYNKPTGFPANGILAATFNKELAYQAGKIIGEDGLWAGFSGLYGIGANIHRSPYLGRTCEYYSECGTLTGVIAGYECKAIEEKGVHVYNKHCALNDMENTRHGVCDWISEQALREIYLRAFELPITIGDAYNTMASFSRFGTIAAPACKALGTDFLRGECGMKGIIVTDAYGDMDGSQNIEPYFEMVYGILVGGSDIPDGQQPKTGRHYDKFAPGSGYSEVAWAMRESVKRVCYQTLWSNAMNGYSSSTRLVPITPWWQKTLYAVDIVLGVIFAASLVWTGVALFLEEKERRKA